MFKKNPNHFTAQTAYIIGAVFLLSTGHFLGAFILVGLALFVEFKERELEKAQEKSNLPSDESGEIDASKLPDIFVRPDGKNKPEESGKDPWDKKEG